MSSRDKLKHPEYAVHRSVRKAAGTMRWYLVTPDQEPLDAVIDVLVNGLIGPLARTVVEVGAPTSQQAVQLIAYFRPRCLIPWNQDLTNLVFDPLHALLRRTGPQIPSAVRLHVV